MTGARAGEVYGLRWYEETLVDQNGIKLEPNLKGRVYKIGDRVGDNKGNGRRYFFLNDIAKSVLEKQRGRDPEYVIVFDAVRGHYKRHLYKSSDSRRDLYGSEITVRTSVLSRYRDWELEREALVPVQVKDLRSAFASRLRSLDVHLYNEKDIMGHVVKDVTRRYAQPLWSKLIGIVNQVFPNDPRTRRLKVVNG